MAALSFGLAVLRLAVSSSTHFSLKLWSSKELSATCKMLLLYNVSHKAPLQSCLALWGVLNQVKDVYRKSVCVCLFSNFPHPHVEKVFLALMKSSQCPASVQRKCQTATRSSERQPSDILTSVVSLVVVYLTAGRSHLSSEKLLSSSKMEFSLFRQHRGSCLLMSSRAEDVQELFFAVCTLNVLESMYPPTTPMNNRVTLWDLPSGESLDLQGKRDDSALRQGKEAAL